MGTAILDLSEKSYPKLYSAVRSAIAKCSAVDECKSISDKAVAMAAYYKQVKDQSTVKKFFEIKLRAWRRIGEILSSVDTSDCEYQSHKYKKIREHFSDEVTKSLSDNHISQALKLAEIPVDAFDRHVERTANGSIVDLIYAAHPATVAYVENNKRQSEQWEREEKPKWLAEQRAAAEVARQRTACIAELEIAHNEALSEVGVTLQRKDRFNMKSVVFIIRSEVHATMRQAAFDYRITMQELLRQGLTMWLSEHGYRVIVDAVEEDVA